MADYSDVDTVMAMLGDLDSVEDGAREEVDPRPPVGVGVSAL